MEENSARSDWLRVLQSPEYRILSDTYGDAANDPRSLFEAIGTKLASSQEEIRKNAFWDLILAMPELATILHERETRRPGWRSDSSEDSRMVNGAMDLVVHLYYVFVQDYRFKTRSGSQDPRPFVRTIARNWETDHFRKTARLSSLDEMLESFDGDPGLEPLYQKPITVEGEAVEKISIEECREELHAWGFLDEKELGLFEAVYGDDRPIQEICQRLGIPSQAAARQIFCRTRKRAILVRDTTLLFILRSGVLASGKIPDFVDRAGWKQRTVESLSPAPWLYSVSPLGEAPLAIRPLTRSFSGAPGHLFLLAIRRDCLKASDILGQLAGGTLFFTKDLDQQLEKQIGSHSISLLPYRTSTSIDALSTDIPSLNKALAEVDPSYRCAVVSSIGFSVDTPYSQLFWLHRMRALYPGSEWKMDRSRVNRSIREIRRLKY